MYARVARAWQDGPPHCALRRRAAHVLVEVVLIKGETVADWIYILNPLRDVLDQEPCDKEKILGLAEEDPEAEFWLSRRNRMVPGDRVWFFFTSPDAAIAAVGEVDEEPRLDAEAGDGSYLVPVTLLTEATKALYRAPVGRDELGLGQVRSVQKVKPAALPLLLERAGL